MLVGKNIWDSSVNLGYLFTLKEGNMSVTVTKEFTFDCAHMLSNHEGLCANVHGHTYKLQVGLVAINTNQEEGHPEEGMLIDFKELKKLVKQNIVDEYDHAFIHWTGGSSQEIAVANVIKEQDMRIVEVPFRTTCENMAKDFFQKLSVLFWGAGVELCYIRLWETPTSFTEVYA